MSFLVFYNEQQLGPIARTAIQEKIAKGEYPSNVPIWQEGMVDWVAADTLLEAVATKQEILPLPDFPQVVDAEVEVITMKSVDDRVEEVVTGLTRRLISDEQDPAAVKKILSKVSGLLTSGEEVNYVCVQKKPVVTISPDAIVLTNRRFIFVHPKLTGFTFKDFQWRQVHDVHLSEQMLGATISCLIVGGEKVQLDSIPKKQARKVYAYAQQMEENMLEERRERSMEEKRAAAGGVVIQNAIPSLLQSQTPTDDPMQQLSKLKQLLDAGLIEQSEFDSKKAEILSRM
ncbi:PH domain-containing protein [Verrucomicrobiales bacterium BCK34]|nr:PH domain-containing protein [Verrucomicrobiales bacterium BCK34]